MIHQSYLRPTLLAVLALCLAAAPLGAQTSDVLNYAEHINVDFEHSAVLPTTTALYYRDGHGDLQGPPTGARSEDSVFSLFSTQEIGRLTYNTSESSAWVSPFLFGPDIRLTSGSEVSYTPIQTGFPPPTNGPNTLYDQAVTMTGTRSAIYGYDLVSRLREAIVVMYTDPPVPPYAPGNALLSTGWGTAILTTGGGSISTIDYSGGDGRVTPLGNAQDSGPGELYNPSALAIGPDGLLYVLDAGNSRIQKFTVTTGEYQGGFALPEGLTVYSQLLKTTLNPETGVQEIVYDTEGKPVYNNDGGNVFSSSMAISTEGRIYLGDGAGGGFVLDLAGDLLTTFHPPAEDSSWVDGGLVVSGALTVQNFGVGSYLQYDGMGNIFTYVEGKGLFRYRDPSYDELDFVNLTVGGNSAVTVTSGPGVSVLGSLSFRNDLSGNFGTLTIVDPVTVRTGNLYVQRDEWGRDSTGVIEGGTLLTDGDMHKINDGTLILNNVNTYTGKTIIDDGKLIVNGSIAGDAVVTDNATLGGHGLIGGSVTINSGGTISPGNSPGTLTTGAETWAGGGAYVWELNTASDAGGAKGVTYDWLNIGGQLSIDSTSGNKFTIYVTSLTAGNGAGFAAGFVPGQSYTFTIATATTPIAGFSADKFLIDTSAFFNDTANTGGFAIVQSLDGLSLNLTYTAVPEPGAWGAILGLGLLALAATRKLRRSC